MAVRSLLLVAVLAAALAMVGCGSSESAAPADSAAPGSTAGTTAPGAKAPSDAATGADASKGERDGSDMPGGGPDKS